MWSSLWGDIMVVAIVFGVRQSWVHILALLFVDLGQITSYQITLHYFISLQILQTTSESEEEPQILQCDMGLTVDLPSAGFL